MKGIEPSLHAPGRAAALAIEQLEIIAKIPAGPSYGELRFDPTWDSLRGDPRFEKIVASLAPKNAASPTK